MRKIIVLFLLISGYVAIGQTNHTAHIFNDTSLFFIRQPDSLHPVALSAAELAMAENIVRQAIDEFNRAQQRYADSINPRKKKRSYHALQIDLNHYYFRLIPGFNSKKEKIISIDGDCKDFLEMEKGRPGYDGNWKRDLLTGEWSWMAGHVLFISWSTFYAKHMVALE